MRDIYAETVFAHGYDPLGKWRARPDPRHRTSDTVSEAERSAT